MNALLLTTVLATLTGCPQHRTWNKCCPQPVCAAPTCCQPVAVTCCSINCTSIAPAPMAAAAATEAPAPPKEEKSLYERLGGEAALKAVVDDFVGRAAGNAKVNFFRKGTDKEWKPQPADVDMLKKRLVQLLGAVTGGPQKYEGKDMKSLHAGMKITAAEFGAIAGDLKATLDKFKVPAKEQAEVMKIVGGTAADIIEVK